MSRRSETRLMIRVARMYYVLGHRQQQITDALGIHQSTISRMLKRARELGLVRTTVDIPTGIFADIEEALEARFDLREVIVVDCPSDEPHMIRELGAAAAYFLESTLSPGEQIGLSSWSRHLLAMVDELNASQRASGGKVVQILGGVGSPETQSQATHLVQSLARLVSATPVLLPAPAVTASSKTTNLLLREPYVRDALACFPLLDTAIVGIGALEPSSFIASSGNSFSADEREALRKAGAVGDICMRFFDRNGKLVKSSLHDRVIGIDLKELRRIPKVVGIAGGQDKLAAITAALRGKLLDVLITDRKTASRLLKTAIADQPSPH